MSERLVEVGEIIRVASAAAYRETEAIYGRVSKKGQSRARWILWRALKIKRRMSLTDIAWRTGDWDHTSVMYGLRRLDELLPDDPDLQAAASRIAAMIPARGEQFTHASSGPGVNRYPASPGLEDCPFQ